MPLPRLLLVLLAAVAGAQEANYKLVFEDNFDGDKLDPEIWEARTGNWYGRGNCTDEALAVKEGLLSISAWTENKAHFSGRITLKKSRHFGLRQGKVEGRLRFNPTPGICSIFSNNTDEEDTKLLQVGVEIFASWGQEKGRAYTSGVSWKNPGGQKKTQVQENNASVGKFWHTYGVEWDDAGYRFTLDGRVRMTIKNAEGSAARRGIGLGCMLPSPENTTINFGPKGRSKAICEVDWVKVWQFVPTTK
jgi:hypothetical protein